MKSTENNKQPTSILFTHYGDNWIRGSERALLDLLCHLDKHEFTPILWCNQKVMEQEAHKLGITVYRSDFPLLLGWRRPYFNLFGFFKLIKQAIKLIDTHQIKLLHANSAAPCQWLNFAGRQRNIPLICHLHSNYQLRDRLTLGLYQVSMVVGVSRYVLDDLKKDQMPINRTCVINNGIDRRKLLAQQDSSITIDRRDFIIATVGSLIKRKGIDLIISAVAQLIAKQVPVHLLIIGDGPEADNLQEQINQLGLQNHISLLGEQDNVLGILRSNVDLVVSAAREEAFGLVLAEASLARLPVVATAVGGIPEVVVDGETGILVPSEDIDALANAINTLYQNPYNCHVMGKAGYNHVRKNFNIENNSQHFSRLYHKLISEKVDKKPWYKNWSLNLLLSNTYKGIVKRGSIHGA
jgi:glycosyltransferase involved in cell wall biosynthesis